MPNKKHFQEYLSMLIDTIRTKGAVVNTKHNAEGNVFSVQVSGARGIPQHAMSAEDAVIVLASVLSAD